MQNKESDMKFLTVKDIQDILHIGRNKAYYIFSKPDFPAIRIGKRFVVEEKAFINWAQQRQK